MLKKTSVSLGLVIAAAAGAPLTSSPAYAHANMLRGGWHSHHYSSHHSHHRNRNWNGNRHRGRIFIRIYVYNKNNNHAVALARPERREARRESFAEDRPFFAGPARRVVTRQDAIPARQNVAGPEQVANDTVPGA